MERARLKGNDGAESGCSFIRKGDLVYIMSEFVSDYYYVKGIQHDADVYSMTMELEYAEPEKKSSSKSGGDAKKEYKRRRYCEFPRRYPLCQQLSGGKRVQCESRKGENYD